MLQFEKVIPKENQIDILYEQLINRANNISHKSVSHSEHVQFVKSHPYREWFLITKNGNHIGNFYIQNDNSVGVNLFLDDISTAIRDVINFVEETFTPLPSIPSVRFGGFFINVPWGNKAMIRVLNDIGYKASQISFPLT
jgi:hypothetical protein